ncbi:MAG: molybdopterin-dependent oxidoreductase [Acidimicrobiales bacterium]
MTDDFPVLTAGPTIDVDRDEWRLSVSDGVVSKDYDWDGLHGVGVEDLVTDIHCVTHWTKLGTRWSGVPVGALFDDAGVGDHDFALVSSYGDYTTNLPVSDLVHHDAMVAVAFDGAPIERVHGGPVRLVVPHLYFWKSAKWLREIRVSDHEEQGFWEAAGYHDHGDPWTEQRYHGD